MIKLKGMFFTSVVFISFSILFLLVNSESVSAQGWCECEDFDTWVPEGCLADPDVLGCCIMSDNCDPGCFPTGCNQIVPDESTGGYCQNGPGDCSCYCPPPSCSNREEPIGSGCCSGLIQSNGYCCDTDEFWDGISCAPTQTCAFLGERWDLVPDNACCPGQGNECADGFCRNDCCGDNSCNFGEDCSSCSGDCGSCCECAPTGQYVNFGATGCGATACSQMQQYCGNDCMLDPWECVDPGRQEDNNARCSDGQDNDCDGPVDCADSTCNGILNCCQGASDCDDANVCTTDSCSGANQCVNSNNNNNCGTTSCPADSCSGVGTYQDYPATCNRVCSGGSCPGCSCTATTRACTAGRAAVCEAQTCGGSTTRCHMTVGQVLQWDTSIAQGEHCTDGYDNDCDGGTDCSDTDCSGNSNYANACDSTNAYGCTRSTSPRNACDLSSAQTCGTETSQGGTCADSVDNDCGQGADERDPDCGIGLSLSPDPVNPGNTITAIVTANDGSLYDPTGIRIRINNCGGAVACTPNGAGACTFPAPAVGTYTYYACHVGNINFDGDTITVIPANEICNNNGIDDDQNNGGDERDDDCPITLSLAPNPSTTVDTITATVTANDGSLYDPTNIDVRENTCLGTKVCDVNSGGTCTFPAPAAGSHTYIACHVGNVNFDTDTLNVNVAAEGNCGDSVNNDATEGTDEQDPDCPITLNLNPDPTSPGSTVTVTVTANDGSLYNPTGIDIRKDSCVGAWQCDVTGAGTCTFSAPGLGGHTYYACHLNDLNSDSDGLTVQWPPEDCGNNQNDDGNPNIDEQQPGCDFTLSVTPNPATYTSSLLATVTANDASLYNPTSITIRNGNGCGGTIACTLNAGGTCPLPAVPNCQISPRTYTACYPGGSNSDADTVNFNYPLEICNNQQDDDCDNDVDEADSDCATTLVLNPNPVAKTQSVTATFSADDGEFRAGAHTYYFCDSAGCAGNGLCNGLALCSNLNVNGLASVDCPFNAPSNDGAYGYWACLGTTAKQSTLTVTTPAENCNNDVDDDVDGFEDEADSDCAGNIVVTPSANPTNVGEPLTLTITSSDGNLNTDNLPISIRRDDNDVIICTTPAAGPYVCNLPYGPRITNDFYVEVGEVAKIHDVSFTISVNEFCSDGWDNDLDGDNDQADDECPIDLRLSPKTAGPGVMVNARVFRRDNMNIIYGNSGNISHTRFDTGTDSFYVKINDCTNPESLCELSHTTINSAGDMTVLQCQFPAPNQAGQYRLVACIGTNTNEDDDNLTVSVENCTNDIDDDNNTYIDESDSNCVIGMSFNPDPALASNSVVVNVSANDSNFNSNSNSMSVHDGGGCADPIAGTCSGIVVDNLPWATCSFTAPPFIGEREYTACLDNNSVSVNLTIDSSPEGLNCNNGIDDDVDGYVDEADSECTLYIDLEFDDVCSGSAVTATVVADDGNIGSNYTLYIREGSCAGTTVCNVTNPSGASETCVFDAPVAPATYYYYACMGENEVHNNSLGVDAELTVDPNSQNGRTKFNGTVVDVFNNPLLLTEVRPFYPPGNPDEFVNTNALGYYEADFLLGNYTIRYFKEKFFSEEVRVDASCGQNYTIDVTLLEGSCNALCFNWENRCNADCHGREFPAAGGGSDYCRFNNSEAMTSCDGKKYKSWAELNQSGPNIYNYVECCEGAPFQVIQPEAIIQGDIDQLYKRERLVTNPKTGQPAKLVINIW